ncbi:hypothetical protein NP233_g1169 [Leucocoprinus birnbaumii]|uniref:Uncharacterized protein n=1 Tax=Leucocoprinus birnbaumii TaxID=56174 RepID=A0AAD5YW43_9AGAR|nr:hypothetical protein NP233_g1169 [Leucocoprinus birnbaumii]
MWFVILTISKTILWKLITLYLEEYATLREQWIRETQGIIFVYSTAHRITFERLEYFRYPMLKVTRGANVPFVLVGTKADKEHDRQVSRDEGAALARTFGCSFFEASAKSGKNIDVIFSNIIRSLRTGTPALLEGAPVISESVRVERLQREIGDIYSQLRKTAYGQTVQGMFHKASDEQSRILGPLLAQADNEDLKPEEKEELEEKIQDEYILCLREFRGYFAEVKAMGIKVGPYIRDFYDQEEAFWIVLKGIP